MASPPRRAAIDLHEALYAVRGICGILGWPRPPALRDPLARINQLADEQPRRSSAFPDALDALRDASASARRGGAGGEF
jgi:hypothetical protein